MGFAIIRVQACGNGADKHNKRKYKEGERPQNIKPGEEGKYGFNTYWTKYEAKSINEAIEKRIKEAGVKVRKNSTKALEYVVALSPDAQKKVYDRQYVPTAMLDHLVRFLEKKHGKENIVSIDKHFDESNPHAHVVVVPIVEKEVRYKNRFGDYTRKELRLSARDFTGGRQKLRDLQSDFSITSKIY